MRCGCLTPLKVGLASPWVSWAPRAAPPVRVPRAELASPSAEPRAVELGHGVVLAEALKVVQGETSRPASLGLAGCGWAWCSR